MTGPSRLAAWLLGGHAAILIAALIASPFEPRLAVAALIAAALVWPAAMVARRLVARLPRLGWPPPGRARLAVIGGLAIGALSLLQTGRLAAFSLDRHQVAGSTLLGRDADHMCLAAYVRAGELVAAGGDGLYDRARYAAGERTEIAGLGRWLSDPYHYPPPFLLGPRLAVAVTSDYGAIRAAWFALHGLGLAALLLLVALWFPPEKRWRAIALTTAAWMAAPVMINLQYGQVHMLVSAAAVASMVAFARRADVAGGLLLAAAISAKLTPAILLGVLLVQRRWRPLLSTAAWMAGLALAALAVLGSAPFASFARDLLPHMASGESFAPFFEVPSAVASNLSLPYVGYKLGGLGLGVDPLGLGGLLKWPYLAGLAGLAWVVARRDVGPRGWLALVLLGSLSSPYAPGAYAMAPGIWLLALIAVEVRPSARIALAGAAAWGFLQIAAVVADLPGVWRFPRLAIAISIAGMIALAAMSVSAALYPRRSASPTGG